MKADENFVKEVIGLDKATPAALVFLEAGLEPVEIKIMKKRALYFKYIADHPDDLIFKVLEEQMKKPAKGDWWKIMKIDLEELDLKESLEEVRAMSKDQWKMKVNLKAKELAFKMLLKRRSKLKKGNKIKYKQLKMKEYLTAQSNFNLEEMKDILKIRSEMVELPKCLPHKFGGERGCRYNCQEEEDIKHTIQCKNDFVDNKLIQIEDIDNIIEDNFDKEIKIKLKDFKRILMEKKNTMITPNS